MKKIWSLFLTGMLLVVIVSACSNASAPANPSTESTPETNNTTDTTNTEPATPATTDTESSDMTTEPASTTDSSTEATEPATESNDTTTNSGSLTEKGPIAADSVEKRPTYLPTDFPIPDDAVISTSHQEENKGKKSVLLIFTTKGSMETLSQTYKQYFDAKSLTDATSTIDEKNLIIQGTDPKTKQVWSIIGGAKTGKDVVELTVSWSEN